MDSNADLQYLSGKSFRNNVESLRLAIDDLIQTFGERYPDGQSYLRRLQSVDEDDLAELQREALLANPLVSGQLLLYVARALDDDGTHTYLEPNAFNRHFPYESARVRREPVSDDVKDVCRPIQGNCQRFQMLTRTALFRCTRIDLSDVSRDSRGRCSRPRERAPWSCRR
jgi:hypothetical protein